MTDELKTKSIEVDIDALPQQVREWLMSIALTYLVIDLNKRLGINNNLNKFGVIPDLIGDIATKKTSPKEMASKIAKYLEIDQMKAASIAKEIKEKMLRPIEVALRKELGVDINLIDFQPGSEGSSVGKETSSSLYSPGKPAPVTPVTPSFQAPSAGSASSPQAGSGQVPPRPTPPPIAPAFQMPHPTPSAPPTPPAPEKLGTGNQAPETSLSKKPEEITKIPINVIKEESGKDSWLNRLK